MNSELWSFYPETLESKTVLLTIVCICHFLLTLFSYPGATEDTNIASSGIPPSDTPRSPLGLQSRLGRNPGLHIHENAPGVFLHSVEAASHCAASHSFISANSQSLVNSIYFYSIYLLVLIY